MAPADGWRVEGEGRDDVISRGGRASEQESIRRDRGQKDEGGEMTGRGGGGRRRSGEGGTSRQHGPIT